MSDTLGVVSDPTFRGTFNIFTTCVSILVLCAWTSIHINITDRLYLKKFAYACLMIFAPEVTLTVAIVELLFVWRAVRELNMRLMKSTGQPTPTGPLSRLRAWMQSRGLMIWGKKMPKRREKWTLVEGFFAWMKGFVVKIDNQTNDQGEALCEPLTLLEITKLQDYVILQTSYTLEIRDKSKVDSLSKLITLFQAMWFVIQCVTRTVQHLPLSILELGTLGYVAVTVVLYIDWLYKPKDVRTPILLGSISQGVLDKVRRHDKAEEDDATSGGTPSKDVVSELDAQPKSMLMLRRLMDMSETVGPIFGLCLWEVSTKSLTRSDMQQALRKDQSIGVPGTLVYIIVCTSFGLWHCVAWNSFFPTNTERLLWRIASFLSALPGVILLVTWVINTQPKQSKTWFDKARSFAAVILMLIWACLYLFVRGFLFVEMFLALRRMPDGVFQTIHWTDFFPHI
ncbi:hypothetical protein CERSUDRAFT_78496 [Gelatoporia subvermispora B]|uniref:Uncharacterized protein n=1 Tax=Ceriporiopsis subvermispora (strain B) TaxID=914234 RepID=M2QWX0_CERS8|nr:hypothetical protein CERSUDRAFT_78496 [Gelatoporia subvermispora B]